MNSERDKEILLRTFAGKLDQKSINTLYTKGEAITYPARKFLCRQGAPADRIYIMLEGCVSIYSEVGDDLFHIGNIRSGTFGEIALLLNEVRAAHIMTREETRLLEISASSFEALAKDNPRIALAFAKMILKRLVEQDKEQIVRLKTKRDQVGERESSTAMDMHTLDLLLENVPIATVAREVFSKISWYGAPKTDSQHYTDIFMLMPFAKELEPVYGQIKKVAEELNLSFKRGDDVFTQRSIMADVWSLTNHAKVVVCDCTQKNPNVFYELGIAHTLGKPTILITQQKSDIPFDLQGHRYILYESSPEGLAKLAVELKRALRKTLKLPS